MGLVFDEGTGLSGQAILSLLDSHTIEILLTNTSTAIPNVAVFDSPSDQLLTSLYVDLGDPGLNDWDPRIIGGTAFVGDASSGAGGASLAPGENIDSRWGYGNFKYTEETLAFLPPNLVTALAAHSTAFDGHTNLKGPDYGTVSAANLLDAHSANLPSIADTVRICVTLDQAIDSLASIVAPQNDKATIEFGSDAEFFVGDAPPGIPEPLTVAGLLMGIGSLVPLALRRRRPQPRR